MADTCPNTVYINLACRDAATEWLVHFMHATHRHMYLSANHANDELGYRSANT
jgi:hypothetical protein